MKEYAQMFKRTFDFKGRSTAREFWLAQIFNTLFVFVLCLIALPYIKDYMMFYKAVMALDGLYNVIVFIPSISLLCRRFRDAGFSPLIALVALVPVIGIIILFCLLCMPSKYPVKRVYDYSKTDTQTINDSNIANNFGKNVENNNKNEQNSLENNEILQKTEENKEITNNTEQVETTIKNENEANKNVDQIQSNVQKKVQVEKVSKAEQISRSQKIKRLQEQRDNGEISIQEYQQEILKLLSK